MSETLECVVCRGAGWYAVPVGKYGDSEQKQCDACQGVGGFAVPAPVGAETREGARQPSLSDLWDAFEAGAREQRGNADATERDAKRAADAYVKMWAGGWTNPNASTDGFVAVGAGVRCHDGPLLLAATKEDAKAFAFALNALALPAAANASEGTEPPAASRPSAEPSEAATVDEAFRRLSPKERDAYTADAREMASRNAIMKLVSPRLHEAEWRTFSRLLADLEADAINLFLRYVPALSARPAAGSETRCDCGAPLRLCYDCAVGEYQAGNPDCATCCPPLAAVPPSPAPGTRAE